MEYTSYEWTSLGACLLVALAVTLAARRRGALPALAVWLAAAAAAAAHASSVVWGDELLREYALWRFALGGASAFAVPTTGALVLAMVPAVRRRFAALPHAVAALAVTAAMFVGGRSLLLRGNDVVVSTCDEANPCRGGFAGRAPAERVAARAALPPCGAMPASGPDGGAGGWTTRAIRRSVVGGLDASLRLPASMAESFDLPDTLEIQEWAEDPADGADLTLQRDDSASISTGFGMWPGGGTPVTREGECRATVAGRIVGVRRYHWTRVPPGGGRPAATFAATTDVPLAGDAELGVGVSARSAAARDTLHGALLAMRLGGAR